MIDFEITRLVLAFICGYFLTISGSLSQLVSNNSLASPSTLGMDGAAVLLVLLSQLLVLTNLELPALEWFNLIFVIIASFVLYFVLQGRKQKNIFTSGMDIKRVILFGLAFNLFIGAIFSIIQFLFMALNFDFPSGLWFGSIKQYEVTYLWPFGVSFCVTFLLVLKISPKISLLNLGNEFATGLGINVFRVQIISLMVAFFLNALVISFFGVFSFLGLIFPHILRSFKVFNKSMSKELLYGPLLCATIFAIIDLLCFNFVLYGAELPVGMVSSVIGAFFLIFLVLRSKISRA